MKFGDNLKEIRKSKNISQEELAEELGVSRQSVSKWETGENYPSMQNIVCLCTIFKCKMNDIVHEDFEDLDFLGEEVKMNVVKLNEQEQKKMKTISKVLYLFGRIGKIVMRVAIVSIIILMVAIPFLFAKLEVVDDNLVYKNSILEIQEKKSGIEITLDNNELIKVADFDSKDVEVLKEVVEKRPKAVTISLLELGLIILTVTIYLVSKILEYLEKLFMNIHQGDTPFTLDNVNYIKKMVYLMIACIILPIFGEVFIDIAIARDANLDIDLFNVLEIVFLYAISLIFEYGYRIQKDSKGIMYETKKEIE
jgi:transcriptional regulator with XRE-family HTH domain